MSNEESFNITFILLWDNGFGSDISVGLVLFLLAVPDLACVTGNLKKSRVESSYIVAHIRKKALPFFSFSSNWTHSTEFEETRDTISGSFLWPAEIF